MTGSANNFKITLYSSVAEIEALVRAFESCSLPRSEWTHSAHLTMALFYLLRDPETPAIDIIRTGIKRFNAANGIVETPTGGYHETLTMFWTQVVHGFVLDQTKSMLGSDTDNGLLSIANLLLVRFSDPKLPFSYYSRELLFSPEARREFVAPDLQPLR